MLHCTVSSHSGEKFDLRKFCLIIISLALVSVHIQAQNGWTQKQNMPTPRGTATASVINNKIYVIGGSTAGSISDLANNEVYDPLTNNWEVKAPMTTARGFLTSEVVNDTIYAIGGGYPIHKDKNEAYDPVTNSWTTKAVMLGTRLCMRAGVVNGKIYIIGGNYNQHNCQAYDPSSNMWTEKTPVPEGGGVISATVYNGLIYVFGGGYYGASSVVWAYNPQTDTWTKKQDMPTPRFAFQTYLVGGKIYAMGGAQSEYGASLATVEVYDPVTDTWERKSNMPFALAWFSGVVVNDKIYVIGGTSNWGVTMSNSVWEYDPAFHTDIAAGNVSGTWTKVNSPYYINGEITVPNGETLTIEPGVEVVFKGHYKFNVQGRLLAVGTQQDSISFTAENTVAGWHGIRFINTPNTNDLSKIVFCSFRYGKANTGSGLDRSGGAIMISGFDKVLISDCLFEYNMTSGDISTTGGPGVCIFNGSPIVTKSTFRNNTGASAGAVKVDFKSDAIISNNVIVNNTSYCGAVLCAYQSDNRPTISGNFISNNTASGGGGGIFVFSYSNPRIENNVIVHNQSPTGGGIYCFTNAKPVLINNTIAYNTASIGGGISCEENSDPILINNILYGNTAATGNQVYLTDAQSDPVFVYCNIQGGKDVFGGSGAGANYTGLYENSIDSNPLFTSAVIDDYTLTNYSSCIGAGISLTQIAGVTYSVPPFCFGGNPRPSPSGTLPDIGACENLLGFPLPVELILFTAMVNGKEVTLNWLTATELNNQGFEVQRKFGSNDFVTVGSVKGNGTTTSPNQYSFVDKLIDGGKYSYRLKQIDFNGTFEYSDAVEVEIRVLDKFTLEQNYPNPFNPTTKIKFAIPLLGGDERGGLVLLKIFDLLGNEIVTLVNEYKPAGSYEVEFNASGLSSGMYFYKLETGNFTEVKKMILIR